MLTRSEPASPAPLDVPENRVFITCFYCIAIFFTLFRLARRARIHRLSWDDGWAAFATLMVMGFLVVDWVKWGAVQPRRLEMDATTYRKKRRLITALLDLFFLGGVWSSRVSIALCIARILPNTRHRKIAIFLAIGSFSTGVALIATEIPLILLFSPSAPGVQWLATLQIVADFIASVILVLLPLYALWDTRSLPTTERRLVMVLYTGTVLTLMACIAQTVALVKKSVRAVSYAQNTQLALSVIVCNFLVVITTLFRLVFRRKGSQNGSSGESEEEGDFNSGEYAVGTRRTVQHHPRSSITSGTPNWPVSRPRYSMGSQLTEIEEIQIQTFSLGWVPDSWDDGDSRGEVETPESSAVSTPRHS